MQSTNIFTNTSKEWHLNINIDGRRGKETCLYFTRERSSCSISVKTSGPSQADAVDAQPGSPMYLLRAFSGGEPLRDGGASELCTLPTLPEQPGAKH